MVAKPAMDTDGMLAAQREDGFLAEKHLSDGFHEGQESTAKGNGICDGNQFHQAPNDRLVLMVIELSFQNEYLKAQFEGLSNLQFDSNGVLKEKEEVGYERGASEDVKKLHAKIESLNKELLEQRQTQNAAEDALKHLQRAFSEADAKASELSLKLTEAQQKMEQEIKERDDKYNELDSKFGRLHKRAKQRIQEIQKEKDDLEARLRDVNEMAEKATSQQTSLQQELERTRQQANEALRVLDGERQQLRTANNKLRDSIEEVHRSLETKEKALEGLQYSLFEKEQMLEEARGLLQAADEKKEDLIAEISLKHQRQLESLEAQLADALSERSKAAETISSLQVMVANRESQIAEMEAAASGEAVRLKAAVETAKGEIVKLKEQNEKEKESWETAYQALKFKLEQAESTCLRSEIEAARIRSQLESELSVKNQLLSARELELVTTKDEINHLESEFSSYKVRAHALLQRKDAELAAAKESELLKAQEEAIKEVEKEVALASAERDRALQDLKNALDNHDKELAARDEALSKAEQQIRSMEVKLDSASAHYRSEKEAWQKDLEKLEQTWQLRCETLVAQNDAMSKQDLQEELEELKLHYKKLKEEHESFRDIADRMIEEKDKEISRLLDDNENLHQSLLSRPSIEHNGNQNMELQKQETPVSSTSAAEQQILLLARQQAQREEELAQSQRHILALQEEIEELERENRLHTQQEAMLKEELRKMERTKKREGVDMTYLKNVILKLLETGEVEALLPVIGMLLQFSPEEIQKCQQAYRYSSEVTPSTTSDASPSSSSRSLFSRFTFL